MKKILLAAAIVVVLFPEMPAQCGIRVISPNGGENLVLGALHTIRWHPGDFSGPVRLVLRRNENRIDDIALDIPNNGLFNWQAGNLHDGRQVPAGSGYKIRVRGSSSCLDDSDAPFTLMTFKPAELPPGRVSRPAGLVALKVCVSNNKEAPINRDRDIHVWIKNIGNRTVNNLTLNFFIEGKGTSTHVIQELIPLAEHSQTRRHSWSTAGKRKITAQLLVPGGDTILVNGSINIHLESHRYALEPNMICADGSGMNERDIKGLPKPEEDPLDLLVCASDGKNPLINARRDIHVWVRNTSSITYKNLLLEFYVQQRGTTTHTITSLGPDQELKFTRNHSWGQAGDKKIKATVYSSGRTRQVSVESSFKVSHPGRPTSSAELNVKCSDNSQKKESDF